MNFDLEELKTLLAERAHIDRERVRVTEGDGLVTVAIQNCTEEEQRRASSWMQVHFPVTTRCRVVREETGSGPSVPLDQLHKFIDLLGLAPDGQLDTLFAKRCAEFSPDANLDTTLEFLRNLRDECVFGAGASGAVMKLFACLLEDYPEPDEVKAARRAVLDKKYGLKP
jgi:hypothetical protein